LRLDDGGVFQKGYGGEDDAVVVDAPVRQPSQAFDPMDLGGSGSSTSSVASGSDDEADAAAAALALAGPPAAESPFPCFEDVWADDVSSVPPEAKRIRGLRSYDDHKAHQLQPPRSLSEMQLRCSIDAVRLHKTTPGGDRYDKVLGLVRSGVTILSDLDGMLVAQDVFHTLTCAFEAMGETFATPPIVCARAGDKLADALTIARAFDSDLKPMCFNHKSVLELYTNTL
jgi:hypothetical protein